MKRDIKAGGAYVELMLRKKRFQAGLKAAGKQLLTFAKGAAVAGTAAATAAAGGIAFGIRQYIKMGDELDKMSKRTGVAVGVLSELKHASIQSGADVQQLEKAFAGLSRSMFDAARGSKEPIDALKVIGLTFKDLKGLSPEDQMAKIADGLASIGDESTKGAVAQRLFGRAGRQMLPLLREGSKGMRDLRNEARAMSLTMSGEAAAGAARLLDMFSILGRQGKSLLFEVGAAAAPLMEAALPPIQNMVTTIIGQVRTAGTFVADNVGKVTSFLGTAWQTYYDTVAPINGAIAVAFQSTYNFVADVVATAWTTIQEITGGAVGSISSTIGAGLQLFQDAWLGALSRVTFAFDNWRLLVNKGLLSAGLAVVTFGNQAQHFFGEVIPSMLTWFVDNWQDYLTDVANITKTIAGNIWKNLKGLWDAIVGLFNGEGFEFEWTDLTDGYVSAIKELPKIAEREMGPLEKAMTDELKTLTDELDKTWDEHQKDFAKKVAEFTPANPFSGIAGGGDGPKRPDLPKLGEFNFDGDSAKKEIFASFSAAALAAGAAGGPEKTQKEIRDAVLESNRQRRQEHREMKQALKMGIT